MVESQKSRRARLKNIIDGLEQAYPDSRCSLNHENPWQLLVATVLSAQCTDKRVNLVTPALFRTYPEPFAMAEASLEELEEAVRTTGFFRSKSKHLSNQAKMLVTEFGGEVPNTLEDLVKLPGVGRKTANVVLGVAMNTPGVVVDTHVTRLSNLMKLVPKQTKDAVKIEQELMKILPKSRWTKLAHLFIDHGRAVCKARKPVCDECVVEEWCPGSRIGKD